MELDFISVTGIGFISSLATLALVAETEPQIDEESGEEYYTTKGYIILTISYIVRSGFNLIKRLIVKEEEEVIVEGVKEIEMPVRNGYELII